MKIIAALLITFLSIYGVKSNNDSQPESINNNTQMKLVTFNRTMMQLPNYFYRYPVQVTYPMMNDMMTTNDTVNSTMQNSTISETEQSFRLLLPPRGYDATLCTPSIMTDDLQPKTANSEPMFPTGLFIKTDTRNNCTLSSILSNVIELNRKLPESEAIQYLVFPLYKNVSYIQMETINEANNNLTSELVSNNITIVYMQLSYVNAVMKTIQIEMMTGCSPFLLESDNANCNIIYQLNETVNANQQPVYPTLVVYAYWNMFILTLVVVGLVFSCVYHRKHPLLTAEEQGSNGITIDGGEKIPSKLTEKQFESLPQTKYTLDLVEKLKYGNSNNDNNTVVLDGNPVHTDSTLSTNITSSTEQPKEEMTVEVKDGESTHMTSTTRITNDEKNPNCSYHSMIDVEAPLHTISLDNDNNNNTDCCYDDECGVTCPICIEEFVVDEIVIVLPKCNHIYHSHCIREWVMRKQGCCPYCKVLVIDDENVVVDDVKNDDNNQEGGRSDLENQ